MTPRALPNPRHRLCFACVAVVLCSCAGNTVGTVDDGPAATGGNSNDGSDGPDDGFDDDFDDGFDDGVDDGFDDGFDGGSGTTGGSATASGGWDDDGPAGDTEWGTDGWPWGGTTTADGDDGWATSGGEQCVSLDLGGAMGSEVLAGALLPGSDSAALACGGSVGRPPDTVLRWTPPDLGDYTIRVDSADFDPVLGVRDDDCLGPVFGCNDNCVGSSATLVVSGWQSPLQIIVESAGGASGNFSLSITAGASVMCE